LEIICRIDIHDEKIYELIWAGPIDFKTHFKVKIFKTIDEFYNGITDFIKDIPEVKTYIREEKLKRRAGKSAIKMQFSDWLVIMPTNKYEAMYWGRNGHWCISTTNMENNKFDDYYKENYIFILKSEDLIWCILKNRSTGELQFISWNNISHPNMQMYYFGISENALNNLISLKKEK